MQFASYLLLLVTAVVPSVVIAQQPSVAFGPQIVRVSFVDGDVRVARGKDAEKAGAAPWEQAVADLPIEAGFSLVTGEGRAEIEFEDSSVLYLAPNSVLEFLDLTSSGHALHTEVALLSGMASIDYTPSVPGDDFAIRTPTDRFAARNPQRSFVRVNAYLDAATVTHFNLPAVHLDPASIDRSAKTPVTVSGGKRIAPYNPPDPRQFTAWDHWVLTRVAQREAAQHAVMQEAHLQAPIPGLAEMSEQGHFFDCAPYGTCWEPNEARAADSQPAGTAAPSRQPAPEEAAAIAGQTVSVKTLQQGGALAPPGSTTQNPSRRNGYVYDDFPCEPGWERTLSRRDPATGLLTPQNAGMLQNPYPYRWAVCHTGTWIHRNRHYVWVVGHHPHHHAPCVWVKTARGVGIVPIHPNDVAGKPPLNLANGVRAVSGRQGPEASLLAWSQGDKFKVLETAPRGFRTEGYPPLLRSAEPHMLAFHLDATLDTHLAAVDPARSGVRPASGPGTPIVFDRKTQSFNVAHDVHLNSGATRIVSEPIGGRGGTVQARFSSSGAAGSQAGSASRGSYSGSYNGGGGSGGGGNYSSSTATHSAPVASAAAAPSAGSAASVAGHK